MRRQRRGTYPAESNPYLFFFAALCAHAVAIALIAVLPSLTIEKKPEQVVTINLVDMPGLPSSGAASSPPPKAEKKPPPPEPTKIEATPVKEKQLPPPVPEPPQKIEAKPVKEKPEPVPEPPPQVVSLRPKQQVKKMPPEPPKPEVVKPKKDDKAERRQVDKIKEQLAQESRRNEQRKRDEAAAEARKAEEEAAQLLRDLEEAKAQSRITEARAQGLGTGPVSSGADSALAKQYQARIVSQLQSCWKLPDYRDWSPNLLATAIVTIDKSGKILDVQFEKRSSDDAFDRLVRKTLGECDPLPPIPPAMKKERLEFGFNFNPGGAVTGR